MVKRISMYKIEISGVSFRKRTRYFNTKKIAYKKFTDFITTEKKDRKNKYHIPIFYDLYTKINKTWVRKRKFYNL